jgi:hypothetical protein
MTYIFNQEQLKNLCNEWQKVLGLSDWDIKITISRAKEMFDEDTQAGVNWVLRKKTALIKILDPIDYKISGVTFWEQDMEQSLVHELMHLHIASFDNSKEGSLEDICVDQVCDIVAKGFVKLKRQNEKELQNE